jgi:hypothetical protein
MISLRYLNRDDLYLLWNHMFIEILCLQTKLIELLYRTFAGDSGNVLFAAFAPVLCD